MKILISLNGIFPRSPSLIEKTRQFERKIIKQAELEIAYKNDYENLKTLTTDFDLISDGLLCWQDLLRPFSTLIKGCEVNGLVRYFQTNNFYRQINLPSKIQFDFERFYRNYFRFGNTAFLPSVGLFKRYSNAKYDTIVKILSSVVEFLEDKNYKYVVFQNPKFPFEKKDDSFPFVEKLIKDIRKRTKEIKIIWNTFFYEIYNEIERLQSLEIDAVGIDFTANTIEKLQKKGWKKTKGIFAGILNMTTTKVESEDMINKFLLNIQNRLSPAFIIISGTPDFEFLPLDYATLKIHILKKTRKTFENLAQTMMLCNA
jgi:methionine synthase II (cobalamin-independent)